MSVTDRCTAWKSLRRRRFSCVVHELCAGRHPWPVNDSAYPRPEGGFLGATDPCAGRPECPRAGTSILTSSGSALAAADRLGEVRPAGGAQLEVHADGVDLHIGDCLAAWPRLAGAAAPLHGMGGGVWIRSPATRETPQMLSIKNFGS
jgi:hypothetical protein